MMTDDEEENAVRHLGKAIGYGRTMQLASDLWSKHPEPIGSGALMVGPCRAFIVKCDHPENGRDANGHCDWCCGCGWVTKKVAAAMSALPPVEDGK